MGYLIQGQEVTLPVEIRDARVAAATFLLPANPVQELIAATGLEVARLPLGRAMCSVAFVRYVDGDLGQYNEIAFAVMVRHHDGRKGMAPYIHQLPVDEGFTLEAGQTIWGFPKFMTQSTLAVDARGASVSLSEGDDHILTMAVRRGPLAMPDREMPLDAYSFRDGVLRRTRWQTSNHGTRARPGGATLVVGDRHPMAAELPSVGLPRRAVMSSTVDRMRARFEEPEVCN